MRTLAFSFLMFILFLTSCGAPERNRVYLEVHFTDGSIDTLTAFGEGILQSNGVLNVTRCWGCSEYPVAHGVKYVKEVNFKK